jgi:acyl carrier protein
MPAEQQRINSVMLSIIRRRTPSADVADFDKQIYDLDMDSLDVVDLSQALEKEFGVAADLERVADCLTPAEIGSYFRELIGSP